MKLAIRALSSRDQVVAALLGGGTLLASLLIAAGVLLGGLEAHLAMGGEGLVRAGIALFILLPIARVALLLALFLRERDGIYAAISALVLLIIGAGVAIGLAGTP